MFVDRRKAFLARVMPQASMEFDVALQSISLGLGPSYRRCGFHEAQEVSRRYVVPWSKPEQKEAEKEYRHVALRFVEMGNDFLQKLAEAGIPELARMPHALDPESGFRVRSKFTFMEFIEVVQPASPLRWLADLILGLVGARKIIEHDAREFLARLLETNSTRVQSDILDRSRRAEGSWKQRFASCCTRSAALLNRHWPVREEHALHRLDSLEQEIRELGSTPLSTLSERVSAIQ
jgi:hypothetical protein